MSSKRFYQKPATERQRECRQRTTNTEFDSKLKEIRADGFRTDITDETPDAAKILVGDCCEPTNSHDCDQFDNADCVNGPDTKAKISSEDEDGGINNDDENSGDIDEDGDDVDESSDNDDDENDIIIRDFISLFDVNREQKLYSSCNLSIYSACMEIVKLCRTLNLNKLQMQHLLNGLRLLLPTENKLPRTVPSLLKIVDIDCSKQVSYYCRRCFYRLTSPKQSACSRECFLNGQRRSFKNVSELVLYDVKKEISSTARRYINLIQEYQNERRPMLPSDVLNGQIYRTLPSNKSSNLTLMLHADGAPVTKVGRKSLWPIQCTLVEIPPPIRDRADATMIFGAWLGGTHPNRNLLWCCIVEQIQDLFQNGITINNSAGQKFKFIVRAQYATFDLPALAQNCNTMQFNGYDACPDCDIHGVVIERQVFYPYSATPSTPKTDRDYTTLTTQKMSAAASKGIKGPMPLTKVLIFPDQIVKDYMHLVCSGHFKTLVTYWEKILLPGVFDQASDYLMCVILPHSFRYQFTPLAQYSQWKTKMFRDFLLYISPVFVSLFLPDSLALHFIHYFLYIRALYFYEDIMELNGIENIFDYYYKHIVDYYGEKSQLCTLHLHSHLKDQVLKHGALVFTSCFGRESYIGYSLKWCIGKKYILEQFSTWYQVDRSLATTNSITLDDIFHMEKLDETYMDKCYIQNYQQKLIICSNKRNIDITTSKYYSRYSRGIKMFHSRVYTRGGNAISYLVSVLTETCPMNRKTCLAEVLFYFRSSGNNYAFIKKYRYMDSPPTCHKRARRSTAGINKRYDEQHYVLVSFPQLNKHSIVPAASIDIDPLDKQIGSIKTFGSRKNLRIVSSGPKEVMKERASRYAVSAGSEEVELVPDEEENKENQDFDDEYSPSVTHRMNNESKKRITSSEQSKSQIQTTFSNINDQTTTTPSKDFYCEKTPLFNRQLNFNRVYSSKTGTKRRLEDNQDESSLSGSDEVDDECADEPCSRCKNYDEEFKQLEKRIDKLEKVIPVIKKFRSKTPITTTNQTNAFGDTNEVYKNIEQITGVSPNQIKSTPTRPTIVMRELIKKSGHIGDRSYLKEHENLFKDFIQMKCMILDDNMSVTWKEVMESLSRQHIDEENNKKKKINKQSSSSLVLSNTTSQCSSLTTVSNEEEATATKPLM
ncbi:unnamed protein product [Rotaria sp. Silwood2]|nr:unnamed protein product [Rotaria sp. Silwood2]CAF4196575.1 unnamed protein product [Rotaria sp. Silwood2]